MELFLHQNEGDLRSINELSVRFSLLARHCSYVSDSSRRVIELGDISDETVFEEIKTTALSMSLVLKNGLALDSNIVESL